MTHFQEIILIDSEYIQSLMLDIDLANSSIDLETYIFADDEVGKKVAERLCKAAARGVDIRVVVDGVGASTWGGEIANNLENAGIKTKIYHPLPWKIWHWRHSNHEPGFFLKKLFYLILKLNSRNHRKVCIIDKRIIYVGSANIYGPVDSINQSWRETTVKLVDVNIDELQYAFDKAWGVSLKKRFRYIFKRVTSQPTFRLNHSWRRRRIFYKLLLHRINHCKKRIWVTNSYFVPDSHLLNAIIHASKKGVDVRILLPGKSDVLVETLASATFYATLLKSGAKIYEYMPTVMHAKILIVDDWYSLGSTNLNYRSFRHDLEIDVNIRTQAAKDIIYQQYLYDLIQSRQVKEIDLHQQSVIKQLLGKLVLLIRYWL